eukprot:GHVS01039769.1.p1 GENE.GHVS01039769.1~~GHVS01039769.1.p1  ORF type:complete len:686 (-),score=149.57 GHVS01039769.1:71-2128(-)
MAASLSSPSLVDASNAETPTPSDSDYRSCPSEPNSRYSSSSAKTPPASSPRPDDVPSSSIANPSTPQPSTCSCSCLDVYQADKNKLMHLFKDEKVADAFEVAEAMLSKWPRWFTDFDEAIVEVVFRFLEVVRILMGLHSGQLRAVASGADPGSSGGGSTESGGGEQKEEGNSVKGDGVCDEVDAAVASNTLLRNFVQKRQRVLVEEIEMSGCKDANFAVIGMSCDGHRSRGCSLLEHFLSLPLFSHTFHMSSHFLHPSHSRHLPGSTRPPGGLLRVALQSAGGGLGGVGQWLGLEVMEGSLLDKVVHQATRPPDDIQGNVPLPWKLVVGKAEEGGGTTKGGGTTSSSQNEKGEEEDPAKTTLTSSSSCGSHKTATSAVWDKIGSVNEETAHKSLKMWIRHYEDNPQMLSLRLDGHVEASLTCILSVLNEVDLFKLWIPYYGFPLKFGLKEAGVRADLARVDKIVYFDVDFPWPFASRDALFEVWAVDDLDRNQCVTVKMAMCNSHTYPATHISPTSSSSPSGPSSPYSGGPCPPPPPSPTLLASPDLAPRYRLMTVPIEPPLKGVERLVVDGGLVITPLQSGNCLIQLLWHENPQMRIPDYMLNFAVKVLCTRAFNQFRRICKDAQRGVHKERRKNNRDLYGFIEKRLTELGLQEGEEEEMEAAEESKKRGIMGGWLGHWGGGAR